MIIRVCARGGRIGLNQRYTQRQVGRILGLQPGRLLYWERLHFVRPRARWGERFYTFSDLVGLRSLQQVTGRRIKARRVRKALSLMEEQFGAGSIPLHRLRLVEVGGEIAIVPPGAAHPFDPFRRQWLLPLEDRQSSAKLCPIAAQSAHDLFEAALRCEETPELLPSAVDCYRKVIELAPNWIEAHINLGVAYYQMGQLGEAREAFLSAVQLDPGSGISRYNLGCVLEEQGAIDPAIDHLRRAATIMPAHADVHFNLALAYEKKNDRRSALEQWRLYLRFAPNGPWADQARSRLRNCTTRRALPEPIPFPRKSQAD